jgi:zinc protease
MGFYGLPLDYFVTFKDQVNSVTVEQIKEAYIRRVQADNMITVMVGGKK